MFQNGATAWLYGSPRLVEKMDLRDGDELAIVESLRKRSWSKRWTGVSGFSRIWSSFAGLPPRATNSIVDEANER
jgi:hypothetical protein